MDDFDGVLNKRLVEKPACTEIAGHPQKVILALVSTPELPCRETRLDAFEVCRPPGYLTMQSDHLPISN